MLINPREFGRKLRPEFVKETEANVTQVSGAMIQHVFAKGIREALMERGMSVVTLSEMTGLNYQRLTRMLRGSVLMRLDDIGMIARALPEAFDSVVGRYDPRDRFDADKKSRLARIYEAARPMGYSPTEEPVTRKSSQATDQTQTAESLPPPSAFRPPSYSPLI
ncbi:helix-turn-helix domain-containing protein [Arthrobacter sp. NPDC093139]|uniref:helix-turn-helix domain-containing protein n=1 Tax=Arthrobacter sp. NPDC093139 TaxID=3363945 RepID=UPI00380AA244